VRPLFEAKIFDYGIEDFATRYATLNKQLPSIIESDEFTSKLMRFIPPQTFQRTLERPYYLERANELHKPANIDTYGMTGNEKRSAI
jgi:hypothetical protein